MRKNVTFQLLIVMKHNLNNLPLSNIENLLQIVTLAALGAQGIMIALYYPSLPDRIPIHFGITGAPDGWGDKWMLLLLLGVSVGTYLLMRFATTISADKYNYPVKITPHNQKQQYLLSRQLMFMMNAGVMLLFLLMTWGIIQTAKENMDGLGSWFFVALVVLVFGPIGYTLMQSSKYK